MTRNTRTTMKINVDAFNQQRALIEHMVTTLENGRTAFAIIRDKPLLSGILGILDEINDQNDLDNLIDCVEGPECPGCTDMCTTLECPDCEYNNGIDN